MEEFTVWKYRGYRGYTMKQLDELIDFAKQQMFEPGQKRQMIRPYTPMQFIPPALSQEQLEQIRAVMREELQEAKKQTVWTPEDEDTFLRGVLRSRLSLGIMSLPEYRAELARLDKQKMQASDTSTDASLVTGTIIRDGKLTDLGKSIIEKVRPLVKMPAFSLPAVKYVEYDLECDEAIEGHPSVTAELEHLGKLYKGVLYYVKDVE